MKTKLLKIGIIIVAILCIAGFIYSVHRAFTKDVKTDFVQGNAYKIADSEKIYTYIDEELKWIPDEGIFQSIYGGLPEENLNYTIIDSNGDTPISEIPIENGMLGSTFIYPTKNFNVTNVTSTNGSFTNLLSDSFFGNSKSANDVTYAIGTTGTGWYSGATNQANLATNGVNRLTVSAAGSFTYAGSISATSTIYTIGSLISPWGSIFSTSTINGSGANFGVIGNGSMTTSTVYVGNASSIRGRLCLTDIDGVGVTCLTVNDGTIYGVSTSTN